MTSSTGSSVHHHDPGKCLRIYSFPNSGFKSCQTESLIFTSRCSMKVSSSLRKSFLSSSSSSLQMWILGASEAREVEFRMLMSNIVDVTNERSARTVIGVVASVENVSVNLKGSDKEHIGGADRETMTFGGRGCELRVLNIIVSLPSAASQSTGCLDTGRISGIEFELLNVFSREFKASFSPAGQCEIEVVGLKHNL